MDTGRIARPTKSLFVDWESTSDPIASLQRAIGSLMRSRGIRVREVMIHPTLIAKGFTFAVEYRNEWYYLINKNDMDWILASAPEYQAVKLSTSLWGIPIVEDEEELRKIVCGVWYGSIKLGYFA